ncbi:MULTISPECIES: NADH-quinone oxidoreductase subunit C [Sanguibacteroides]|uniref:NADH-quinone oxidoreductase subunit D n=1 Tax=Sanguibacteroides justesenii TaxID=1547597 RepID=A0A0C3M804_9PORP|nr:MULTISPECIES: NADH-quinone oxidoreductase subunit C [Sanguibacteroides]KIO42497.1 NADH-quinone oxidoreductase subunit C [Sanguibacteroides justesenii]KIO42583.1 NADH-quinone oxidoreductase subunit C [Sanguibacteroides justesenii]PXZ42973.1 NADH-quinone oxidoreductase subunit D [Sanguibacteroides justesenii]
MLTDKIKHINPDIVIEENGIPTVIVPVSEYRNIALFFKNDPQLSFDYLVCMTGMDWGDSMGVINLLESTIHGHRIFLKTSTTDRENPELPSISDIWETANLNEREVFDFFGIRFINHPDMRRLFLRNDWVGYPLRKDYDASEVINPVRIESDETLDTAPTYKENRSGEIQEKENIVFKENEYVVNIGPQHPATHGVLRFRVSLEGEIVKKVDVNCGYIHRGIEKLCETLTYPQTLALTDRLDYLAAQQNRHALCMCIEEALQIEIPERVKYIRTLMDELNRLSSHLLFWSALCMDLGALTAFFYGFRDREKVLNMLEETTGGRLIQNYNVIGGVMADIHPNLTRRIKEFITYLPPMIKEYHEVFTGNIIAQQRLKNIGILSKENAISYGVTGPSGRASGWACDVRKRMPYGVYDKVDFKEIIYNEGDSFSRYMVRMEEMLESLHILEQLVDNIPAGDFAVKTKPVIKLPEGQYFKSVEASRGEFGVYIESRGEKTPYRMKFRSPCLTLVSVVDQLAQNNKIADLIAIGGTLDYVVPDLDR